MEEKSMEMLEMETENKLKELFLNVVNNREIKTVFQPIISLRDGQAYGYEALSRGPQNTEMHSPEMLFRYAEKCDALWELDLLCRSKALEAVSEGQYKIRLFLNVYPNVMHDIKFRKGFTKEYLDKFGIDPQNIIFEINEKAAIQNMMEFRKTVSNYKEQNYKIAIDDAGAGYSGLNMISDIHPHFLKLDMNLIRDIDKDHMKQALVRSMVEFSKLSNTFLIAEGIETEQELAKLIEIGVHYGQGFYIQRPCPNILPVSEEIINSIHNLNMKRNHLFGSRISDIYISNITTVLRTLNPNIMIYQVQEMMRADLNIPGYCITDNETVLGVITRDQLFGKLSTQYGYSLHYKKPISDIISADFMSVDHTTPIDLVAKTAMQRKADNLYDFITVTKDNKYFGIVTVRDLLEKTIEIEIVNAKHLNPLSELPGNLIIEKQLEKCVDAGKPYTILYFDIDNFKSYNDVYGFEKGDMVIRSLTFILKENISSDQFIGHIGGDDFIAVVENKEVQTICNSIISQFDSSTTHFYSTEDLEKGFILSKNRHGVEESYPLMSISIAGVLSPRFNNIYEISETASMIKKKCKQVAGSIFMMET
ncbi:MAG: bifunctional diguanylate cyclase/phosphodiesterase [Eubacteriales bacterium]